MRKRERLRASSRTGSKDMTYIEREFSFFLHENRSIFIFFLIRHLCAYFHKLHTHTHTRARARARACTHTKHTNNYKIYLIRKNIRKTFF